MWLWIAIGVLITVTLLTTLRNGDKDKRLPPGPSGLPILGYLPFIKGPYHVAFKQLSEKYGPLVRLRLGFKDVVVLNDLPSIREALANPDVLYRPDNFIFRELGYIGKICCWFWQWILTHRAHVDLMAEFLNFLDTGILAMNGEQWQVNRRYCFHALRNLGFVSTPMEKHIQAEVLHLVDLLSPEKGKHTMVALHLGSSLANVISALMFGQRFHSEEPGGRFLERLSTKLMHSESFFSFMDFFPGIRALLATIPKTRVYTMKCVMKEMAQLVKDEVTKREGKLNKHVDVDFIDGYLKKIQGESTDRRYTLQNLQGNVANIYGASTNPVRRTILWCLYIAAADPDGHQATLQREIDAIVGHERTPQWEYRHRMPLTMAFILETLRWKTISPISVHRVANRDTILSGYHIPAGTFVVPNLWSLHNDSTHWRRPEIFDPARFLNAGGTEVEQKPHAFLPFSLGRRACPGETLALTEIFLYVTTLLQKFRVLPEEGKPVSLASGTAPRATIDHTQRLQFVAR
ncbi:cytochrome P450 2J2-like [Dermacentor andersoni]|uniref:cytochrome P450 2J2-like n=1 Tax=Dermacentor andersoni TaxID=34620 RepID=UPI003B39FF80